MAAKEHDLVDTGITFASGAAYGMTTVAVGQPFDTIKTVVQSSGEGTVAATRKVIAESGIIKGLWRGSLPLVLGGTFMRSAQFGCNDLARDALRDSSIPSFKIGGVVESHIVLAGMCGGLGRADGVLQDPAADCRPLCGNQPVRPSSTSTPSSRRSNGNIVASMAWGA